MALIGIQFYDCTSQRAVWNHERSSRGTKIYPVRQQHNTFDPFEWQFTRCPAAIEGSPWPPICIDQLTKVFDPEGSICLFCKKYTACTCCIHGWRLYNNHILTSILESSHISNMLMCQSHNGIDWVERPVLYIDILCIEDTPWPSLFTYRNIPEGRIIGEITGKLRPAAFASVTRNDLDVWPWFVGRRDWARLHPNAPYEVVVDCTEVSSATKFMNHSCAENCMVFWARVGHTRGLFVRTIQNIPPHSELTIWDQNRAKGLSTRCRNHNCQCPRRIQRNDSVFTATDPAAEEYIAHEAEVQRRGQMQRESREAEERRLAAQSHFQNINATGTWQHRPSGVGSSILQDLTNNRATQMYQSTNLRLAGWGDLYEDSDTTESTDSAPGAIDNAPRMTSDAMEETGVDATGETGDDAFGVIYDYAFGMTDDDAEGEIDDDDYGVTYEDAEGETDDELYYH